MMLKAFLTGAAAAAALVAGAAPASAGVTKVTFDFVSGGSSIASGDFTYDSADTGVIDYSNLLSYDLVLPGASTYDLAFVNSGDDSDYRYFGFDTASHTFVTQDVGGFPQIMSDIKNSFDSGFFVWDDGGAQFVADYASTFYKTYDTLNIDVSAVGGVPEPATWAMLLLGLGGLGAAMRSARRRTGTAIAAA